MRNKILLKAALVVLIAAGLSWLFLKTVRDANAEPYEIQSEALSGWTLSLEGPEQGGPAVIALQPSLQMTGDLFNQIFQRSGQSLTGPARVLMPVVLRSEYAEGLDKILSPDQLLEAARAAGLDRERFEPVCVAIKDDGSGRSNRLFVLLFESPGVRRFREELARLHQERGAAGHFDPGALLPMVPIASTARDFDRWWPLHVDAAADCKAPLLALKSASQN